MPFEVPMHKNAKTTMPRIKNFYTNHRFKNSNLLGKIYPLKADVSLSHWALPGGEGAWRKYSFKEVLQKQFNSASVGNSYGPTWSTHWFKVDVSIPEEWKGKQVNLRWDSGSEAALFNSNGDYLTAFCGYYSRTDYIIYKNFNVNGIDPAKIAFYVEMAANTVFGASEDEKLISPADPDLSFEIKIAEIAVQDPLAFNLKMDLDVLYQMADQMKDTERGIEAMNLANQMINYIIFGAPETARSLADNFFNTSNSLAATVIHAIGNCHIDTAWLWPYSETRRKVARSFSSQIDLAKHYSPVSFVGSQAVQWAWLKEDYPSLFEKVKHSYILPVGTAWCELDGNMPSGESFIRQLFFGNKFYAKELDFKCKEFWLPDTFGYSAQIPALIQHCGLKRFLSQKISWNTVNVFPHTSFIWEGLDGSSVIAHFPPADKYEAIISVEELLKTANNNKDKGRIKNNAILYGHGDGGGGPDRETYERMDRLKNVFGIPKIKSSSPDELFSALEEEENKMMRWVGELFLEFHNGTYTSQASMKQYLRLSEFRLRDSELMLSLAILAGHNKTLIKDMEILESAWKKVLVNQFHDVLPGCSIEIVYPEAIQLYEQAIQDADSIFSDALATIGEDKVSGAVNTLQWPRREVVKLSNEYLLLSVPPFGFSEVSSTAPNMPVKIASQSDGSYSMENMYLEAVISKYGLITSLKVKGNDRQLFKGSASANGFGNQITMYDDQPVRWDAWDIMDYHLETALILNQPQSSRKCDFVSVEENEHLIGRLRWGMKLSEKSNLTQDIVLYAECPYLVFETTVDWKESHKALKVVFEPDLLVREANFDIQFGYLTRPTHMNTSWDTARYEVCGHKWADVTEGNFGMAVLNDSKYGWCSRANSLSLTLLKSPKAPDFNCDMRTHNFKYAVMPHEGSLVEAEIMRRGYEFNNPLRIMKVPKNIYSGDADENVGVLGKGIILHTMKPADDASGDIILRVFECDGRTSTASISVPGKNTVNECNGLEEVADEVEAYILNNSTIFDVKLKPFKIKAFRISKNI